MMTSNLPTIPSFTPARAWLRQKGEILAAIERVLDSCQSILGPEVRAFEEEFAAFVGANHAVGVASGTDALIVALRAFAIGEQAEVITVANGPVPPVSAIRAVGAVPKFVDIDPTTYQMRPDRVAQAITARTRAILLIHMYGQAADVNEVARIARENDLILIEDCAHAHGCRVGSDPAKATHVGLTGHVGCFSFYPTKNLAAIGDAGICVTQDMETADRIRMHARYGFRGPERISVVEGLNSRLDEIQAAILRVRLRDLAWDVDRRRSIARQYHQSLSGTGLVLPTMPLDQHPAWHQYVVRSPHRSAWMTWLAQCGIQCGIHYAHPIHRMPAFQAWDDPTHPLVETERACNEVFSLPMFPELTDSEVDHVIRSIREFQP